MDEMTFHQKKDTKEYKEGQKAFQDGNPHESCLYNKTDNKYRLWSLGWIIERINTRVGHILEKYGVGKL